MKKLLVLVMVLGMVSAVSATTDFAEEYGTDTGRVGLGSRWFAANGTFTDEAARTVITSDGIRGQIGILNSSMPGISDPTWGEGTLTVEIGFDILVPDLDQMRIVLINNNGNTRHPGSGRADMMWQEVIVWSAMLDNGVGHHTVKFEGNPYGPYADTSTQMSMYMDGVFDAFEVSQEEGENQSLYIRGYDDAGLGPRDLYAITDVSFSFTPIPEPFTMSLLGLGGLALIRRRKA